MAKKDKPQAEEPKRLRLAKVKLTGKDGNAFAILAECRKAMRAAGQPKQAIDAFVVEAMSGDYDHLLKTAEEWLEVQ